MPIRDVKKTVPQPLRDRGGLWGNYAVFLQNQWDYFYEKFINLVSNMYSPEQSLFPGQLASTLAAYVASSDTSEDIRRKAASAVKTHKSHPIFEEVWKPRIDSITNGNSVIYKGGVFCGSFIVGESIIGSACKIGSVSFVDSIISEQIKGDVYIDLGMLSDPTSDQLDEIVRQFKDVKPIYFNVLLGLTEIIDSDFFVVGSSEIGGIDVIGEDPDPVVNFRSLIIF